MYKYLSESLFSILLGVCPGMELLDHLIILRLIFYEELISTATAHFILLSAGCEVLGFISFFNMSLFIWPHWVFVAVFGIFHCDEHTSLQL